MPESATTTAATALVAEMRAYGGRLANIPGATAMEAETRATALRAAMISAGISSGHANVVALDAAIAAMGKAIENMGSVKWLEGIVGTHATAVETANAQLIAVP